MRVLVVGGGGREHAICLALSKSPRITKLFCAPGNGGIASIAECIDIRATDIEKMVCFAKENADFVMVAPDDPLALGMVDALEAAGIRAFGPSKAAARLEGSKAFAKDIMEKYGIPTAKYEKFTDIDKAKAYIQEQGAPIVVKADGLALGKGVVVAYDVQTALDAANRLLVEKKFGDSGDCVVIEECMTGPEVTILAFTDGKTIVPMISSQDHKRAFTGGLGPNTGGMGAFCPSPLFTKELAETCMEKIFRPTAHAMRSENTPFKGVLYFGLMLTTNGPRVIEYNARFGDPETQPILSLLKTDLLEIFEAIVDERLHEIEIEWHDGYACCVVIASGGYPEDYKTGYKISGLDKVPSDIMVFHAGTTVGDVPPRVPPNFITNGGRVLGVTATGATLLEAVKRAYEGVSNIDFKDAYYRTDIGK